MTLQALCDEPFILTEAGSSELVMRLFSQARSQPKVRYRCAQLLSTLEAVSRGDGLSVVAQASLPEHADSRYLALPLAPRVPRRIGLAVLDRRQSSPAALAFIALAQGLYPSPTELPAYALRALMRRAIVIQCGEAQRRRTSPRYNPTRHDQLGR